MNIDQILDTDKPDWLVQVVKFLSGFRSMPLVLRHHVLQNQARVEVRRWSEITYLRLQQDLWLCPSGKIYQLISQRRRWIRQQATEQIYDEVFTLTKVVRPHAWQLALVLSRLMSQHGLLFFKFWEHLNPQQQQQLIKAEHSWEVIRSALSQATLPDLFSPLLSPEAHPRNRATLLEAGANGSYAPPAQNLPWLILQVEWNLCPGILGLTRASILRYTGQAWELQHHPNPVVRRRLAQLLPAHQAWLDWLAHETDSDVRNSLRLRLEADSDPDQLAKQLSQESHPGIKGAIGWVLMHWSRPYNFSLKGLFKSIEQTLSSPHREILKRHRRKLSQRRVY